MASQGWGYSVSRLDEFLVDLFDRYADVLKRRFSDDFQEVINDPLQLSEESTSLTIPEDCLN